MNFFKFFPVVTSVIMLMASCKSRQESSQVASTNEATTNTGSMPPAIESFNSEGYSRKSALFSGCFQIVKSEGAKTSYSPSKFSKYICGKGSSKKNIDYPGMDSGFSWESRGDGILEDGGAGGFMAKEADCDDCMTIYHPWFVNSYRWRKSGDEYTISFHNHMSAHGGRINEVVSIVKLRKMSETPDFSQPTTQQMADFKKTFDGCFEFSSKNFLGDWSKATKEKAFIDKSKGFCISVTSGVPGKGNSVYAKATINSDGSSPVEILFHELAFRASELDQGTEYFDYAMYETKEKIGGTHVSVDSIGSFKKATGSMDLKGWPASGGFFDFTAVRKP